MNLLIFSSPKVALSLLPRLGFILLAIAGCRSPCRARFPEGTKLFQKSDHTYFGTVVGYDSTHDFHNKTGRVDAVQIEAPDAEHGGVKRIWASCDVIMLTYAAD